MSHCYFPKDSPRRKLAVAKAQNRAKIMQQWMKDGNNLNQFTVKEFHALMRKADKEFKQ